MVNDTTPAGHDDPALDGRDPNRWRVLAVLCLSLVLVMVMNSSLNVALPSMARDLDASSSELQWFVDAYALVFAGMLFAAGTIGDRFGRKGALQVGLGLFVLGAVAGALAQSSAQVIAVRGVMGLGAAFVMPSTLSILTNVFDDAERPRAISLWAGIAAGGAALGPPLTGLLLERFWWGSVFLVTVPISAVALVAGHRLIPTSKDPDGTRLDLPGALLSIVGVGALVYAIIEAPHAGWLSATTLLWALLAVVIGATFVAVERRSSHPMLDLALFRNPTFRVSAIGIGMAFFAMFGMFFLLTQYLQLVHDMSPLVAGSMILPMSATLMLVSPRAPRLVMRYGPRAVVTAGMSTASIGLIGIAGATRLDSVAWVLLPMVVLACGMAVTMTPLTTMIMAATPRARAGMGSATNDATRELGGALGVAVLGSVTSTLYVDRLPSLVGLSAADTAEVRSGLAGAIDVASRAAGFGGLADAARSAFVDGLGVAFVVASLMAAGAALMASRLLPATAVVPAARIAEDPATRPVRLAGGEVA